MLIHDIQEARDHESIEENNYEGETLVGKDCRKMEFMEVVFSKCRFVDCDFTATAFRKVRFEDCDFSNCRFHNGYFSDVTMSDCKGDGCNFSQSTFRRCQIIKGSYHYANCGFSLWDNCIIESADFSDSFFSEVKLKKTKISLTRLSRADFFKTSLRGMDLSDCLLDSIAVSDTYRELQGLKISPIQAMDLIQLLGVKII